MGLVSVGEQVT